LTPPSSRSFFNQNSGGALGLLDLFNGGNLRKLTIFALGIMPYITASIIFQLLTVIYEPLAKLQKEGELGRRKITQWTRYVTVLLAIVQSFFIGLTLTSTQTGESMVTLSKGAFLPLCVITLTCGTAFIMWLGEQITERGVGNGMSLLIFTGIVVGLPRGIQDLYQKAETQAWGGFTPIAIALLLVMMIAVVAFIIFVERSERRIPIQSAKRMVGRSMTQASNSFLPLKVNSGRCDAGDLRCIHALGADAAAEHQPLRLAAARQQVPRPCLPRAGAGRALVRGAVHRGDRLLRLLLHLHHLPPG
jgi:preprotein translocase subunit SecY